MTYDELVKKLQKNYSDLDASTVKEHVAVQFNIEGEGEGALYLEFADGKTVVEPYEYYDHDAVLTTSADVALKLSEKEIDLMDAYNNESVKVWGDLDKVLYTFGQLEAKKAARKAAEQKAATAAKTAEAKKTEAVKAEVKPAEVKKTAEPKAEVKKTEVKKTSKKKASTKK